MKIIGAVQHWYCWMCRVCSTCFSRFILAPHTCALCALYSCTHCCPAGPCYSITTFIINLLVFFLSFYAFRCLSRLTRGRFSFWRCFYAPPRTETRSTILLPPPSPRRRTWRSRNFHISRCVMATPSTSETSEDGKQLQPQTAHFQFLWLFHFSCTFSHLFLFSSLFTFPF